MQIRAAHEAAASKALPAAALFIGGERVTTGTTTMDRLDPTTGRVLGSFPVAGPDEVDRAVRAARRAFPAWRRMGADQRRRLLFDAAALLQAAEEEFKVLVALETGMPLQRSSVRSAVDYLEYYAGWTDKMAGELVASYPRQALDYVRYEPYGVIASLIPWNAPLITACKKLAPALAAGNCVVLKSPELGPFALMRLAELFAQAGLPDGVLSVLAGGPEVGQALIRHPDVSKVSFTGGTSTARNVMAIAAESTKPLILELGGKSANIVFADADLASAAQMAGHMATIASSGQGCLFPTRLLVQDQVYDEMVDRVRAVAEAATIGDPLDLAVTMGPVISAQACDRILGYVQEATAAGAGKLVTGGARAGADLADGFFVEPTVVVDVDNSSRIAQEEIFGPVLCVIPFHDDEEAVRIANDSPYALAAYLHTNDLGRAHRVVDDLDAGYVSINSFPSMTATAPFGGSKASGFGREGGRVGIEEFLQTKNVYVSLEQRS
ncbi:aldehyde dehydrogenase [Mycobacterium sp. DL440]|uniref:aldehyde dehydrogenase family protein n=1 Tax=Mycobacterium sp. DL440 TaxID=2675523 RepID=UPI00141DC071|nr:aldehyde dehydrogenase family protein [Mycobacterium sp. DL440]